MTPEQFDTFKEIRRLLKEAYDDYFARDDGHCKSAEGAVEVYYPNYFENPNTIEANGIMIYSYVHGPSRRHHWFKGKGRGDYATKWCADPFAQALDDVKKWHADQMAWTPDE